eukprot:m.48892 g.48892  ORF g.48892 m.48892 type:complete len:461 (-) comp17852_c0_seq4:65-1447(-)
MKPAKLKSFCVFNPTLSNHEDTEHLKLLFYYPEDALMDRKMNHVGLCEAMVKYTSTFSDIPVQTMCTKKTRQIFLNPEPDFWISMIIELPYTQKTTKDGEQVIEYHEHAVQDVILQSMLSLAYKMYKLFHGTFTHVMKEFNVGALKHKLKIFFPQYLETLDFANADILDALEGLHFLPLDKNSYLNVQSFVNATESEFRQIQYTVVLYQSHLVWSGLEQEDMRVLYHYLTGGLFKALCSGSSVSSKSSSRSSSPAPRSGFMTGPEDVSNPDSPLNVPRIFVGISDKTVPLHLVIYQCHNMTCCFFINDSVESHSFYKKLHYLVGPQLEALVSMIREQRTKRPSLGDSQYKYLYFNRMNLAQKASFQIAARKQFPPMAGTAGSVSLDYLRFLTDMHTDVALSQEDCEIVLKSQQDFWIVCRKSDQREFFVILTQKNANLIIVNEEIRKLSKTHFNNIFFVE